MTQMSPIQNCRATDQALNILGLSQIPTFDKLRKVRRDMIFAQHPDHCADSQVDLGDINKAYETLRPLCQTTELKPECAASGTGTLPRRPQSRERVEIIADAAKQKCQDLLTSLHSTSSAGKRRWSSFQEMEAIRDHVPVRVKRCGRDISYLIASPLKEGMNRVALPTGELVDKRKPKIEIIKLKSKRAGEGCYTVPAEQLAKRFPGARSVQLHFQAV